MSTHDDRYASDRSRDDAPDPEDDGRHGAIEIVHKRTDEDVFVQYHPADVIDGMDAEIQCGEGDHVHVSDKQ